MERDITPTPVALYTGESHDLQRSLGGLQSRGSIIGTQQKVSYTHTVETKTKQTSFSHPQAKTSRPAVILRG